jgi:hypothetical protein
MRAKERRGDHEDETDLRFLTRRAFENVAGRNKGRIRNLDEVRSELAGLITGSEAAASALVSEGIDKLVDREDKRRTQKGNRIFRPSQQLDFDGLPEWLEPDAMLPTMDGGRFRSAGGKLDDRTPILEEADRVADAANRAREEKYAAFRELAPYLAKGMTNLKAWLSFGKDHGPEVRQAAAE